MFQSRNRYCKQLRIFFRVTHDCLEYKWSGKKIWSASHEACSATMNRKNCYAVTNYYTYTLMSYLDDS